MKVLIIIPTYNEIENIEKIIETVLEEDPKLEVLIVDDGSTDGTRDVVNRLSSDQTRIHVIYRDHKMGLGSAYIAGFEYALKNGYDIIFEMDADFSHDLRKSKDAIWS